MIDSRFKNILFRLVESLVETELSNLISPKLSSSQKMDTTTSTQNMDVQTIANSIEDDVV
jgi:hypothetical protein